MKTNLTRREIATNSILSAGSALFALLAAELVLNLAGYPRPSPSGWYSQVPANEQNQLGYRGHRIEYSDDDFVVLLLGDSFVEAAYLPMENMPERQLEKYLHRVGPGDTARNIKVFTAGAGGYGQDQEYLALQAYLRRFRADLVILWITPRNDIWNNLFPTHWAERDGHPKPTFWLEQGELRGPTSAIAEDLNFPKLFTLFRNLRYYSRDGEWEQRLPPAYQPMFEYKGEFSLKWQKLWDQDSEKEGMRRENLVTEKSHLAMMLTPRSPRMQYGLDLANALINKMAELVRANNAEFVIFQPTQVLPSTDIVYLLNGRYYRCTEQQYRENIRDMIRGHKFLPVPLKVPGWVVGEENEHLSAAASDQEMHDLAALHRGRVHGRYGGQKTRILTSGVD